MNTPKVTPKDFFLWAGAMVAAYGSVIAFITLLFQYINHAYPDPLSYGYEVFTTPYSGPMRFAMASLIVLVPVAVLLMRLIRRDIAKERSKADLWVRRWALVLTIFVAGAAVVGDLITLVNYFLGGDLTTRFLLKVIVLLLVAGAAFMHFFADLRGYWMKHMDRARMVAWGVAAVVVLTILAGFVIMGSPAQVRLYRFDEQKVSDLQTIQWEIVNYWQQKQMLPNTFAELEDPLKGWTAPQDPQGQVYRYEKTGDMSFKICATFNAASSEARGSETMPVRAYGTLEGNFDHDAGEVCFDRTIDPERYPPYTKGVPAFE
jgi:hypothetical protein